MCNLRKLMVITILCFLSAPAEAQKNIENQGLLWLRYNLKLNFNNQWQLNQEVEERTYWFPWRQHQFLTRTTLSKGIGKGWSAGAAFTYFEQSFPQDPEEKDHYSLTELRPLIEIIYRQSLTEDINISHRYWSEFRFMEQENGDFKFTNNRSRYRLELSYAPIDDVTLKAFDEIFINIGSQITYNVFDQNRYGFSVQYMPFENLGFEFGYIKWFQQRPSGEDFYSRDIFRFTILQSLSFKKKDK